MIMAPESALKLIREEPAEAALLLSGTKPVTLVLRAPEIAPGWRVRVIFDLFSER